MAVAAFLAGEAGYLDIERVVGRTLAAFAPDRVESLAQLEAVDAEARAKARELL